MCFLVHLLAWPFSLILSPVCRHSTELRRLGQAGLDQPTIDVFGKPMALVPAARLLALRSRALEPESVVARLALLAETLSRAQSGGGGAQASAAE